MGVVQGWGGGGSGRVVLIDNGRVNQSKAADALVQVKTTKFGTNVGLNMLLNISSRYFGGLFWSRQLRGLPSSDGYFLLSVFVVTRFSTIIYWAILWLILCTFYYFHERLCVNFNLIKVSLYFCIFIHTVWLCIHVFYFFIDVIFFMIYRKTSNISCTLVGNKIVDHSDVVGASPVGAAPTTSSFST